MLGRLVDVQPLPKVVLPLLVVMPHGGACPPSGHAARREGWRDGGGWEAEWWSASALAGGGNGCSGEATQDDGRRRLCGTGWVWIRV
jgi:hypothetical protein